MRGSSHIVYSSKSLSKIRKIILFSFSLLFDFLQLPLIKDGGPISEFFCVSLYPPALA
jgi:hypothetical protein